MSTNPLYEGHSVRKLGEWTKEDGYTKSQSLAYLEEALACPIIAVVESKFGSKNVSLTITGKVAEYWKTETKTQGDYEIKRKMYKTSTETITGTLTIPRFTRPWATFLITGLGRFVYEIESITDNVDYDIGKITFYALASAGSKIIYWFGIHNLAEQAREILRPWIAPTICKRCDGTGIESGTTETNCYQCNSYGYSGFGSVKKVQKYQGIDVGLSRDLIDDWENMSESEYRKVNEFINKAWSQKWWVTPTKSEIKRLFAHFYNITEETVKIIERFNNQEPVWKVILPTKVGDGSPFGTLTKSNRNLLKYIARSITPAGVSVFVGFFRSYFMGDLELDDKIFLGRCSFKSSIEPHYELWGTQRWDFYNGWTKATDDFEQNGATPNWENSGNVSIINVNDMNRHMVKLEGPAYMQTGCAGSGYFELWNHPIDCIMRFGIIDNSDDWLCYVEYNQSGYYDHLNNLLTLACNDCDYHLSVDYSHGLGASGQMNVRILRDNEWNNIDYLKYGNGDKFKIECLSGEGLIDAVGLSSDSNYTKNDNWQRLHLMGIGLQNENELSGEENLIERYFYMDRPILL